MTKLEELRSVYEAAVAWDAVAGDAARAKDWAAARADAWDAYKAELDKIQEENSND